jgi:hypothetical protein
MDHDLVNDAIANVTSNEYFNEHMGLMASKGVNTGNMTETLHEELTHECIGPNQCDLDSTYCFAPFSDLLAGANLEYVCECLPGYEPIYGNTVQCVHSDESYFVPDQDTFTETIRQQEIFEKAAAEGAPDMSEMEFENTETTGSTENTEDGSAPDPYLEFLASKMMHPCDASIVDHCDHSSTYCYSPNPRNKDEYRCECLPGFSPIYGNKVKCENSATKKKGTIFVTGMPTPAQEETSPPTGAPVMTAVSFTMSLQTEESEQFEDGVEEIEAALLDYCHDCVKVNVQLVSLNGEAVKAASADMRGRKLTHADMEIEVVLTYADTAIANEMMTTLEETPAVFTAAIAEEMASQTLHFDAEGLTVESDSVMLMEEQEPAPPAVVPSAGDGSAPSPAPTTAGMLYFTDNSDNLIVPANNRTDDSADAPVVTIDNDALSAPDSALVTAQAEEPPLDSTHAATNTKKAGFGVLNTALLGTAAAIFSLGFIGTVLLLMRRSKAAGRNSSNGSGFGTNSPHRPAASTPGPSITSPERLVMGIMGMGNDEEGGNEGGDRYLLSESPVNELDDNSGTDLTPAKEFGDLNDTHNLSTLSDAQSTNLSTLSAGSPTLPIFSSKKSSTPVASSPESNDGDFDELEHGDENV